MKKIDSRVFKWVVIIFVSLGLSYILTPLGATLLFRLTLFSILAALTWLVITVMGKIPIKIRKIVIVFLISFLFAAVASSRIVTGPCDPAEIIQYGESDAAGCSSIWREYPSAGELIRNKHDSLVYFSGTFVVTALISFAILELVAHNKKRRSKKEK
jgi:hypothetical protein